MSLASSTEKLRQALAELLELERDEPAGVRRVYDLTRAHLRSRYPEDGTPLGQLPPPTEPIRDPRSQP